MPDRAMTINTPTLACCGQQRGECSCGDKRPTANADLLVPPALLVVNARTHADPDPDGPLPLPSMDWSNPTL